MLAHSTPSKQGLGWEASPRWQALEQPSGPIPSPAQPSGQGEQVNQGDDSVWWSTRARESTNRHTQTIQSAETGHEHFGPNPLTIVQFTRNETTRLGGLLVLRTRIAAFDSVPGSVRWAVATRKPSTLD